MKTTNGAIPGANVEDWPISYDDLEPDYQAAETLYDVRGQLGEDPTEPPHSGHYPMKSKSQWTKYSLR